MMFSRYMLFSRGELPHTWSVIVWSTLMIGCAAVFLFFSPAAFARVLLAIPWLQRFERRRRASSMEKPV